MATSALPTARSERPTENILKLAILAVGGQGGGVLADWITAVAERSGYVAQSTSVAGVAQRTGATIYYVEMCPDTGRQPVFALSPAQGDVDILIAAELMEAGRAIMRGFVSPERTTLIASTHRIVAVSEKTVPGDGRASSAKVREAAASAAKRFVAFDMESIATSAGTFISASLLGALAGAGCLPFARASFEDVIREGGGAAANLAAFAAAYDRAAGTTATEPVRSSADLPVPSSGAATGPRHLVDGWQVLARRADSLPEPARAMAALGLRKVVDYQDLGYGEEYLDRVERVFGFDDAEHAFALTTAAAKHIANAMCYDDIIRVADLKTRSTRGDRIRREQNVSSGAVLQLTEYFHPRVEEFCGTLPAGIGGFIEARPKLARWIDRGINRGRRIRSDGAFGFSVLWLLGGLRRFRRILLRHKVETRHLGDWLELALSHVATDYDLAVEIVLCRRLIKGYSDTHARGHSKFTRVLSVLPMLAGRNDAAEWIRRLRETALKDEKGDLLDGALKTIATF